MVSLDTIELYKIITLEKWRQSQGQDFLSLSDMDNSFVQFSTDQQVIRTLQKFYASQDMIIAKIDPNKLTGELRFETNPGGSNKYYHLYNGQVPMDSIVFAYKMNILLK